jgi:hypothetical protein
MCLHNFTAPASDQPASALELAERWIENALEEKTPEEKAIERGIEETRGIPGIPSPSTGEYSCRPEKSSRTMGGGRGDIQLMSDSMAVWMRRHEGLGVMVNKWFIWPILAINREPGPAGEDDRAVRAMTTRTGPSRR